MNEELDNYFSGALPDTEKEKLFDRLTVNEDEKKEFARMQNTVALAGLHTAVGDKAWAARKRNELEQRIYRKRVNFYFINSLKYAAVAAILIVSTWFISKSYTESHRVPVFTEIEVPKGQRVYMTFPDGTQAWLSPCSSIKVPNEFSHDSRTVELDGEGFFVVTKDPEKPFIVKTKQYNIQVLGTKFNVFAYAASNRFETDLVEGAVHIYKGENKDEGVYLKPNERVSLENNQLLKSASSFNNEEYLKNGIFNFHSKPFGEILTYLSLWYNVSFDIKDTIATNHLISGKFRQSDEVQNILKALQGAYAFKFRILREDRIEIYN